MVSYANKRGPHPGTALTPQRRPSIIEWVPEENQSESHLDRAAIETQSAGLLLEGHADLPNRQMIARILFTKRTL